ncbi:phage terminase large subunit family protein [Chitinimonas arctica]|uniref:Phage terminase large subunit family protein n=1 Tax=Chitinimonas arctica TaxID=2594795 RepID=A0A516S9W2_9NEIS|nr:phage terminase large subunit family protein [Chitinimonas arctica]QDQ24942.1 phage terminase large subunit family protein [Chitinimonas arctica]
MIPNLQQALRLASKVWAPPRRITVSQWADEALYLSPEDSAEAGKFRTDRAPYQRGIMDAFHAEGIEEVAVMASSQVGKTLIFKAVIGCFIAEDPSPILVVQPTVEMAEVFSKDRLAPMIRDTPALRGKVLEAKSRDSGNTILKKNFPGGHITLIGANAPAGLASRPIRIVLFDEVDRYPDSAGTEGDPVNLGRKRTITFRSRKKIGMFSTPGIKGRSRIERAWLRSDQRRYHVPCPQCSHMHTLRWANVLFDPAQPELACMVCPQNGCVITDADKPAMLASGQWIAGNPTSRIAGFHLNELYSPWRLFAEVVTEYLSAQGNPEELKTWWNTSMGEPYEEAGEQADADGLAKRRESYDAQTLPADVLVVTAGVDTHPDRLEVELVGWGIGEESWGIEPIVLHGPTVEPDVWQRLDELLATVRCQTEDGRTLRVMATCIDSGGHSVQQVYEFCTPRSARNIWAIKGQGGARPVWPKRHSKSKKYRGHTLHMIGVDTAKDAIYARFKIAEQGKAGYCHFSLAYDEDWFTQATVEKRLTKTDKRGQEIRIWEKPAGARNEALDCRAYAYAALQGLKIERRLVLAKRTIVPAYEAPEPAAQPSPPPARPAEITAQAPRAPPPSGANRLPVRRTVRSGYLKR